MTHTNLPWYRRPAGLIPAGVLGLALVAGAGYGGTALASNTTAIRPAAAAPAMTKPATTPRKAHAVRQAPPSYARHIAAAGITCPPATVNRVGPKLVAYWQAGYSVAWTNVNILAVVGITQVNVFNQVTVQQFNVTLPAGGIQPTSSIPPAALPPATPRAQQPSGPSTTPAPAQQQQQPTDLSTGTPPTGPADGDGTQSSEPIGTTPAPTPTDTTPAPAPTTATPSPLTTWWTGSGQSDTQAVQDALTTVQDDVTGYVGGTGTTTLSQIQADAATLASAVTTANGDGSGTLDIPGYGDAMSDFTQATQALAAAADATGVSQASALLTSGATSLSSATSYITANIGS